MSKNKNSTKLSIVGLLCVVVAVVHIFGGKKAPQPGVRIAAGKPIEDWRGAPIGDGEDTEDSYHSYDHRPTGTDPRDLLLKEYTIYPCPEDGTGSMISAQDPRYVVGQDSTFKERNPKFLCDAAEIPEHPIQPCVIYSFGSFDEISFELGIQKVTDKKCAVHTFDPAKLPPPEVAAQHSFTVHDLGIASHEHDNFKRLGTIMKELGHEHIHVLKIDIEGNEKSALPSIEMEGILEHVDQISFEFHSVELMKEGLDILEKAGFRIVFARREDRCPDCTEVTMVKMSSSTQE